MAKKRKIIRSKTIYKKRRLPKNFFGTIIFILLILILVFVGFTVMREWNRKNKLKNENPSSIVTSEEVSSTPSSSEVSSKPVVNVAQELKGRLITADMLLDRSTSLDSLLADIQVKNSGNAVAFELKDESGRIVYDTQNERAKSYNAISENTVSLATLKEEATKKGLKPIACISTLKDAIAPHVSRDNSYAYGDSLSVNWLDNSVDKGGKPWLNPYMEETKQYITDLAVEVYNAGFETIILQNLMFPSRFTEKLNTIIKEPSRQEILSQIVNRIKAEIPNATIYVSFDANQLAVNGAEYIKAMNDALVPILDKDVIRSREKELTASLEKESYTDQELADIMLEVATLSQKEKPSLLMIKSTDLGESINDYDISYIAY